MPNVDITSQEVEDAAAAMRTSHGIIEKAKDDAKALIDSTLGTSLVMTETEAAITDQYNVLHGQLTDLTEAVLGFANQFVAIKDGMLDFDRQFAENIRNPR